MRRSHVLNLDAECLGLTRTARVERPSQPKCQIASLGPIKGTGIFAILVSSGHVVELMSRLLTWSW